jgi:hypothetical protein
MNKIRYIIIYYILIFITAIAGISVYGAFAGPYRTKLLFNSPSFVLLWLVLVIILLISLFLLGNPFRRPGLSLMLIAVICIIIGAMSGSAGGGRMMKNYFGIDKIYRGITQIYKGQTQNEILSANPEDSGNPQMNLTGRLPFSIRLKDFRVEFFEPGILYIKTPQKESWQMDATEGAKKDLGPAAGVIKILKVFKNLQLSMEKGKTVAYDLPQQGFNAAIQFEYRTVFGSTITKYVFERFENPVLPDDKIFVSYKKQGIKNVFSDIEIIKNGRVAAEGTIKVNKPFHYGGFYIYQFDYDGQAGQFSVLQVVSDTGLVFVYTGFVLLAIGAFWHFWLQNIFDEKRQLKLQKVADAD